MHIKQIGSRSSASEKCKKYLIIVNLMYIILSQDKYVAVEDIPKADNGHVCVFGMAINNYAKIYHTADVAVGSNEQNLLLMKSCSS